MTNKKALKYEQKIIRAKTTNGAWKNLRVWLRTQGRMLQRTAEGKAVKIKPYTYKIYYKSQVRRRL